MLHSEIKNFLDVYIKKDISKLKKKNDNEKKTKKETLSENKAKLYDLLKSSEGNNNSDEIYKFKISELVENLKFCNFVYHAPKFIHPSADIKIGKILDFDKCENDGYLKTNNVNKEFDNYGNAMYMPSSNLLFLEIEEKTLYQHIFDDDTISKDFFNFLGDKEKEVFDNIINCFNPKIENSETDSRLRQVYYPIGEDNYILITPLFSSPVLASFTNKIKKINGKFNKKASELEEKNQYLEGGYYTINDLVQIYYGGDKPQNISSLNNKNQTFSLLKSLPPQIQNRKIRIPKNSFFNESIYYKSERYQDLFDELHDKVYLVKQNNLKIRKKRDYLFLSILNEVVNDIKAVRYEIKKAKIPYKGNLSEDEYILLYEDDKRYDNYDWLNAICYKFAYWYIESYKETKTGAISFGDVELEFIKKFAIDNKERFIV